MPVYNAENLFKSYEDNLRSRELLKNRDPLSESDCKRIEEYDITLSGIRKTLYNDETLKVEDSEVDRRLNKIKAIINERIKTS